MRLQDYTVNDTRLQDFNSLYLSATDIRAVFHRNPKSFFDTTGREVRDYKAIEFDVPYDVAQFAYNLACWKLPNVHDKSWMPPRTDEERLFHIFIGCISEVLAALYFKYLCFESSSMSLVYYDVVRKTSELNLNEEFDLKFIDTRSGHQVSKNMSLKVIPSVFNSRDRVFQPLDLIIKGTRDSTDHYYTQFIIPSDHHLNYEIDFPIFKQELANQKSLSIKYWMLGGYVNTSNVSWSQLLSTLPSVKVNNNKVLSFEKQYDVDTYIPSICKDLNIVFKGLV
jgi:hypothetical protein